MRKNVTFVAARLLGYLAGIYLLFVGKTNRLSTLPSDPYKTVSPLLPVVVTMWHGEHFLLPFAKQKDHRIQVLISRSNDGEINAVAAKMLGMEVIRGSGGAGNASRVRKKGGARGLLSMIQSLEEGISVSMTADVPRGTPKQASLGIVTLAKLSGRPIIPVGFASTRFIRLNTWDGMVLTLPFGRGVFVIGDPIMIASDSDDTGLQQARQEVSQALNAVYDRAYKAVGRTR